MLLYTKDIYGGTMSDNTCERTRPGGLPKLSKKLDFYQVISGLLLTCFIFGHLLLVSSVLLGTGVFDAICYILEVTYIEILVTPAILLLIFAHFLIAARKMPFRQGEFLTFVEHSKAMKHPETWAWLIQVITAVCLLALASTHVFQVMSDLPITAAKSAARVQEMGSLFYFSLLICAWLHVGIGIFRMGVKYGFITMKNRKDYTKKLMILVALCMLLGIIAEMRLSSLILG